MTNNAPKQMALATFLAPSAPSYWGRVFGSVGWPTLKILSDFSQASRRDANAFGITRNKSIRKIRRFRIFCIIRIIASYAICVSPFRFLARLRTRDAATEMPVWQVRGASGRASWEEDYFWNITPSHPHFLLSATTPTPLKLSNFQSIIFSVFDCSKTSKVELIFMRKYEPTKETTYEDRASLRYWWNEKCPWWDEQNFIEQQLVLRDEQTSKHMNTQTTALLHIQDWSRIILNESRIRV